MYACRFEQCVFSGQTGLLVPYRKGSAALLELVECELFGARMVSLLYK